LTLEKEKLQELISELKHSVNASEAQRLELFEKL